MAEKLASDVRVFYDGFDLGTATTRVSVILQVDALDPTTIPDVAERVLASERKDAAEWAGLFDDGTSADAAGKAFVGGAGTAVFTMLIGTVLADRAYSGTAHILDTKVVTNIGDLVQQELTIQPSQAWDRGVHFGVKTAKSSSGTVNTGTQDNSGSSVDGGVFYVHLHNIASGTITPVLEDSNTGTTWSPVATAASFTNKGSGKVAITGTIDQFTRLSLQGTGQGTATGIFSRA